MQENTNIILYGTPLDLGAEDLGAFDGPTVLRERRMIQKLQESGLNLHDGGDIVAQKRDQLELTDPQLPFVEEIVRVNTEIARTVHEQLQAGNKVVIVGGDHSVNLGAFSGASVQFDGDIGLIYIDAHGDMNTPESSESHNIHGMHLASLMGFGPDSMTKLYTDSVKLPTQNLLHIGGSDLDQFEKDLIQEKSLKAFTMFDVLTKGLGSLISQIDELAARTSA
jgi:arginase